MSEFNTPPADASTTTGPGAPVSVTPPMSYSVGTAGGYSGPPATADEKNMAMLIYLLGIFTGFIGPLILWLIKKEQSPFINDQGKEVLNFQITTILAMIISIILIFVVIGIFLYFGVIIAYLVLMIMGLLKAKEGIPYRFPFALRLLK